MSATDERTVLGYRQELKRSLSLLDLLAYGLVFIVPIAPVAVFGLVFNASHGMVPLVYLIGLIAMLFTALSYMTMSRVFPVAGSVYTYASRSLGPTVGFFTGWAMLLDYLLLPALTYVGGAVAVHAAVPQIPAPLSIVAMLAIVTVINYCGIETTARASFILLAFQMLILVVFAGFSIRGVASHLAGAQLSWLPFYRAAEFTPRLIFSALSMAVLSFLGFDAISTLSEESRGGATMIARATLLSLGVAAMLFVGQTYLASLFLLGQRSLAQGEATTAAFYNIAALVGGYGLKFLLAVPGVLLAGIAGAVAAQVATARLLFGMARDGELPRTLAHVDPRRKVPVRAMLLVAALTLLIALALADHMEWLVGVVSFGALLGFLVLHVSVVAHFVVSERSRRWMRHFIVPAIGFAVIGYVLWNAPQGAKWAGLAWMGAGGVLFIVLKALRRPSKMRAAAAAASPRGDGPRSR